MIRGLLYLTTTRLNIMNVVCLVARFQKESKESHVVAVKRISRYLKGIDNFCLWYPRSSYFTLITYTDADWAESVDDKKSTSGGAFFLSFWLVAWSSKKQDFVSLPTTKVEYIATSSCCTQIQWMNHTLKDIGITFNPPISIMCDNTNVIKISKNPVQHSKTKDISIPYHFLREKGVG